MKGQRTLTEQFLKHDKVTKKGNLGKAGEKPLTTSATLTEGKQNLEAAKGMKNRASKEKMMDITSTPNSKKNRANGMTLRKEAKNEEEETPKSPPIPSSKMKLLEDSDKEEFYEEEEEDSLSCGN